MNLRDESHAVVDAMADAGLDYAVCGGFAVAIHGYPRLTRDIDILIRVEDLDRTREALRRADYTVEGGMIVPDAGKPSEHRLWRVSKAAGVELVTVGLLLAEGALLGVWQGRERHSLGPRAVTVVSAEGLAKMKLAAGRRKDLDDLDQLGLLEEDPDGGR